MSSLKVKTKRRLEKVDRHFSESQMKSQQIINQKHQQIVLEHYQIVDKQTKKVNHQKWKQKNIRLLQPIDILIRNQCFRNLRY